MTDRRIARELAVILFPQLPKNGDKLDKLAMDKLIQKAVQMLSDYAKQSLADANALLLKADQSLADIEIEHPDNAENVEEMQAVQLTTKDLREQLDLVERAMHLVSEALDIPEIAVHGAYSQAELQTESLHFLKELIGTYVQHRKQIDEFLQQIKANWRLDRMISIDRDILRLACTELFFMDVPINVAISEAVELSHRFADARAAKFINGVLADLAAVASEFRRTGNFTLTTAITE